MKNFPLGILIFEFFRFYGHEFDYNKFGITLRGDQPFVFKDALARSMNLDKCSSILFIEDPNQTGNCILLNLGELILYLLIIF